MTINFDQCLHQIIIEPLLKGKCLKHWDNGVPLKAA